MEHYISSRFHHILQERESGRNNTQFRVIVDSFVVFGRICVLVRGSQGCHIRLCLRPNLIVRIQCVPAYKSRKVGPTTRVLHRSNNHRVRQPLHRTLIYSASISVPPGEPYLQTNTRTRKHEPDRDKEESIGSIHVISFDNRWDDEPHDPDRVARVTGELMVVVQTEFCRMSLLPPKMKTLSPKTCDPFLLILAFLLMATWSNMINVSFLLRNVDLLVVSPMFPSLSFPLFLLYRLLMMS